MINEYFTKLNFIISTNKNSIGLQSVAKDDPTILTLLVELFSNVDDYSVISENLESIIEEHARNDIELMAKQCTCKQYNWTELTCTYDKLAGGTSKCRCCPFCRQKCKSDYLKEHS